MPGRKFTSNNYRYGFNGKEKDDEINSVEGAYDNFGARMYDSRLGRWFSRDPKAYKYTSYSPYHAMYCNPIAVVDKNGKENVVVVGQQSDGDKPNSDKVFDPNNPFQPYSERPYRYGKDTRHFLQAGLDEAIRLKDENPDEQTTMIIYRGSYTQGEIDNYVKLAEAKGIKTKVVDNTDQIMDYMNEKNGELDKRGDDLITDFTYVGHAGPDALWVGNHVGSGNRDISVEDVFNRIDNNAFSRSSTITLNGCSVCHKTDSEKKINIALAFTRLAGKDGQGVFGTRNPVNWGGKLGKFTFNSGDTNLPGKNYGGEQKGDGGANDPDANDKRNEA